MTLSATQLSGLAYRFWRELETATREQLGASALADAPLESQQLVKHPSAGAGKGVTVTMRAAP